MIALFRSLFAPPRHLILLLAALWIGLVLAEKRSERHGISRDNLENLVYYGLFGYLIGGRVLFVLENISAFAGSPLGVFSLNVDLFDPVGAAISAVFVGLLYGRRQRLPLWTTLDALTPLFATFAIGLSLSHLAAGTAFGRPTDLPWGIELWNARRHPTQIYELIGSLLVFGLIWFRKPNALAGGLFLTFTALTAAARLFLEAFRGDSTLVAGGVRLAQLIAWLALAASFLAHDAVRRADRPR